MSTTMRAWFGGTGRDWELREVDVPAPGPVQVLVRVHAAGLNRADLAMLKGTYNPGGTNTSSAYPAGLECAGIVEQVGSGVTGMQVGDRVMGTTVGAFAELALLDSRRVMRVPASLSLTEAGALPVALQTEHDALVTLARFTSGQSVLLTGASSGVGLVGIQIAKALGASMVIVTTTSPAKSDALVRAGAGLVVDTRADDLAAAVLHATDGKGVDIVLDHVGGQVFADSLRATRIGGTVVNIGRLAGAPSTINLDVLAFRRLHAIGTTFSVRTAAEVAEVCAAVTRDVLPLVEAGTVRPVIDQEYAFDDALAAADRMRSGATVGKLVLDVTRAGR